MKQTNLKKTAVWAIAVGCSFIPLLPAQAQQAAIQEGTQLRVNGQSVPGTWAIWRNPSGQTTVGLSDGAWMQGIGGELANTPNSQQQPISWYSASPLAVATHWAASGVLRYLSISDFAQRNGWQLQPQGTVLNVQLPPATVQSIQFANPSAWERRLVLTFDRPAAWQMQSLTNSRSGKKDRTFALNLNATASPSLIPPLPTLPKAPEITEAPEDQPDKSSKSLPAAKPGTATNPSQNEKEDQPTQAVKELKIFPQNNAVTIQGILDGRAQPQIQTLANPPRLVIDFALPKPKNRTIQWAPGLRWQESIISLSAKQQFPVVWLTFNPRQPGLRLLPLWRNPRSLVGKDVLSTMAQRNQAIAAINAGFFSRDRETPLGAIRRNGEWLSSPILNRGIVAWTPQGLFKVGRLSLQETIQITGGPVLTLSALNSGYPQKGIARYTPTWGTSYLPLQQSEQIVTVVNDQVVSTQPAQANTAIPIPPNGYLLVLRALETPLILSPGTQLQRAQMQLTPPEFASYPDIVGAGPLLIDNRQLVVNPAGEQFNPTFVKQMADRSAIAQTADGSILLAATHNRLGGAGPTLEEWAVLLQRMGAINALNLDGGSSTTLYLGGQLIDRHPTTAVPVHNGIGIFRKP